VVEPALRVFGDEKKFRAELRKRLRTADDLRARLDTARDELQQRPPHDPTLKGLAAQVSLDYVPSWHRDEEWDPRRRADRCQGRIEEGVEVIERVLSRLPQAATPTTAPPEARFTEVRQSGLLDPAAFDS